MRHFKSIRQAQRFLGVNAVVYNLFNIVSLSLSIDISKGLSDVSKANLCVLEICSGTVESR